MDRSGLRSLASTGRLRSGALRAGVRALVLAYVLAGSLHPWPVRAEEAKVSGPEYATAPEENIAIYAAPRRTFHGKGEDLVRGSGKSCTECHIRAWYPGKDFFKWEHYGKWTANWALCSVAFFVMMTGIYGAVSVWREAKSPSLHHPIHWRSVLKALLTDVLLGRRIWRQDKLRWAVFFCISMAFLALFAVFLMMVATRSVLHLTFFMTGPGGWALDFAADLLGLAILAGGCLALYRRVVRKEAHLASDTEDLVVLLLLLAVIVTGFFMEACRMAVVAMAPRAYASFVGALGGLVLRHWDIGWTGVRFYVWLVHAALVFAFMAYIPFSKLFHVITCPVSILATASEAAYRQRQ